MAAFSSKGAGKQVLNEARDRYKLELTLYISTGEWRGNICYQKLKIDHGTNGCWFGSSVGYFISIKKTQDTVIALNISLCRMYTQTGPKDGIKQTKKYYFFGGGVGSVIFEFVAASVKKKPTTARRLED